MCWQQDRTWARGSDLSEPQSLVFTYGAPPHAGAAPGVDRLIMLLTGEESIREVITFPMNKNAQDLMMDAPTAVEKHQLDTVHIALLEE